jgi:glycosyltransferase involved in cell wall biosynthesis
LPQPLSIVHVVRSPVGGVFRHIADLAGAQRDAGHAVGLICDSVTAGAFEEERIAALAGDLSLGVVRRYMRRSIGPADLPAMIVVERAVARMRADVIHCHGAKGGVYGRLAAMIERRRGRCVAAFYAPHGGTLHYERNSTSSRIYFAIERMLERATNGLIHVSAYEAEIYRRKVGVPRCPAHVVLNGLRPEEFEPIQSVPDPADFLFIGTLRDLKGVDVYLNALALLQGRGQPFRALIVGAGEPAAERRYRDMAAAAGLANEVSFLSPMPARQAFTLARTVVVPSLAESMPYLVLEAAAAGRPLVATNVGGIPEILHGDAANLVQPGDPGALADALALALAAPDRMAAEAMLRRDRVKEKFSLIAMAAQTEDIYRVALEGYRERLAGSAVEADYSR